MDLVEQFYKVRAFSDQMIKGLTDEELLQQEAVIVSPPLWNLAHTTWIFDVILDKFNMRIGDSHFWYLFNSYYRKITSERLPQSQRGERLKREKISLELVLKYRKDVNERIGTLLASLKNNEELKALVRIGIAHEEQHQELFFSELLFNMVHGPVSDRKYNQRSDNYSTPYQLEWIKWQADFSDIGNVGTGFGYDNEYQIHQLYIGEFEIANRPITYGEIIEFIEDGGYENPTWWQDQVVHPVNDYIQMPQYGTMQKIVCPEYLIFFENKWSLCTLYGIESVDLHAPAAYLSYWEALAYTKWRSKKDGEIYDLPTEFEWEAIARMHGCDVSNKSHLLESGILKPFMGNSDEALRHMIGGVWEWTNSLYMPYPGFRKFPEPISEYNGKFMGPPNMVLRGGSFTTPKNHIRVSYRNFWPPESRWIPAGFRIVKR